MMSWTNPVWPRSRRWYLAIATLVLGGAVLFASSSALATSPRSPATPRYLFSIPPAKVGSRVIGPPPVPIDVDKAYSALLEEMITTFTGEVRIERLSPEAATVALGFEGQVEPQLAGELRRRLRRCADGDLFLCS